MERPQYLSKSVDRKAEDNDGEFAVEMLVHPEESSAYRNRRETALGNLPGKIFHYDSQGPHLKFVLGIAEFDLHFRLRRHF